MKAKQEIRSSIALLNCFDKFQLINQRFYIERLYYLVQNYKRHLVLGYVIVIIKYLELIFLSNNKYIVEQMKVSEPYLVDINKNDMGTFLKANERFSQLLTYAGLTINLILLTYLLIEYIVFAVHYYLLYCKNSTLQ